MTEDELVVEWARAWNTLDPDRIIARLAVDAVYESQNVLEPLRGRDAIADYLRGKMAAIRDHPDYAVRAEIGYVGDQTGQRVMVGFPGEMAGRPCVLICQGSAAEPEALVLLEVVDDQISRVDICTVAPAPSTAERTGVYPGLPDAPRSRQQELLAPHPPHFKTPDLGQRVVETLYQWSNIDPEWAVWHERGFTWWAGPLAQHIWADSPLELYGERTFRVHARTDLLGGFTESDQQLHAVGLLACHSSLSGCIRDRRDPTRIQLATAITVYDEVEDFGTRLLALAASIQVAEAHIVAPGFGMLKLDQPLSPAISEHPSSGRRENLDDMLNVIERFVAPQGAEESRWAGKEMEEVLELLQQPPCVLATGAGGRGLAAEFPFPGPHRTSLLQLRTGERHPRLGNGCLCTLQLPYGGPDAETAKFALRLNAMELGQYLYCIGSWCFTETGLSYTSFLPNAAYRPGVLRNATMSLVGRVRWVTQDVFGYDLDAHYGETVAWKERQLEALARQEPLEG